MSQHRDRGEERLVSVEGEVEHREQREIFARTFEGVGKRNKD